MKGRTLLVDFRPEFGRVDEVKKFKREHRGINDPIRILRPDKALFEQRDAWSLLGRLCNVTPDFEGELKRIAGLSEISELPLSALRNQILYDSSTGNGGRILHLPGPTKALSRKDLM